MGMGRKKGYSPPRYGALVPCGASNNRSRNFRLLIEEIDCVQQQMGNFAWMFALYFGVRREGLHMRGGGFVVESLINLFSYLIVLCTSYSHVIITILFLSFSNTTCIHFFCNSLFPPLAGDKKWLPTKSNFPQAFDNTDSLSPPVSHHVRASYSGLHQLEPFFSAKHFQMF